MDISMVSLFPQETSPGSFPRRAALKCHPLGSRHKFLTLTHLHFFALTYRHFHSTRSEKFRLQIFKDSWKILFPVKILCKFHQAEVKSNDLLRKIRKYWNVVMQTRFHELNQRSKAFYFCSLFSLSWFVLTPIGDNLKTRLAVRASIFVSPSPGPSSFWNPTQIFCKHETGNRLRGRNSHGGRTPCKSAPAEKAPPFRAGLSLLCLTLHRYWRRRV